MRLVLLAILVASTPAVAVAQRQVDVETQKEARRLYEEGLRHYNIAEYEQAIEPFKRAYLLTEAPELLYNIAQSYRLSRPPRCELALQFYQNYLRVVPATRNRASIEGAIPSLEKCARSEAEAKAPPAPAAVVADHPQKAQRSRRWLEGLLMGGGLALAATGSALDIWAKTEYDAIAKTRCAPFCREGVDGPRSGEIAGYALIGVGAAAFVAGTIVLILDRRAARNLPVAAR